MLTMTKPACSLCAPATAPTLCPACRRAVDATLEVSERLDGRIAKIGARRAWHCSACEDVRFAENSVPAVVLNCTCGGAGLFLAEVLA